MDPATNMETQLAELTLQEPALAQSGSNVLRRHIKENPKKASLARHRLWLDSIPHEYPVPYTPYKIGVYIRYFNQTRHENYLEKHIQQYMDDIALCPQWTLVDFYVDIADITTLLRKSKKFNLCTTILTNFLKIKMTKSMMKMNCAMNAVYTMITHI